MHKIIKVRNLHCAACAAELQEELAAADGLSEVSVDFVTQRIALDYDAPASLARAIDMIVRFDKVEIIDGNAPVKGERHLKELISIVISALCFVPALVLHLLGGFDWVAFGLFLASFAAAGWTVVVSVARNLPRAFRGGFHPSVLLDENLLMLVAAVGAFCIRQDMEGAVVMLLYQIGEYLQRLAVGSSRSAITKLMALRCDTAIRLREGAPEEVDPDELVPGDIILLRKGDKLPADCRLMGREAALDTKSMTGESMLKTVCMGEEMLAGCVNEGGAVRAEVVRPASGESAAQKPKRSAVAEASGDIKFTYCTEFIVLKKEGAEDYLKLRAYLESIGDSVVAVDDEEIIKVHVHTNHPGRVLEEALTYGALLTVKIENMREQHTEILEEAKETQEEEPGIVPAEKKYGVVAVCAGGGLASVFRDLGVDGIISGGQTMNPSTEDILREIARTPAETVFVLPNNKNIIMAAQQCVGLIKGREVVVIPTRTVPQGISTLLVMDPEGQVQDNVDAMTEAMSHVHTSEVTYAARNSDFDGFAIQEGDYMALSDGQLFGTAKSMEELLENLAQAETQQTAEFINIFYGEDVDEESAGKALALFQRLCPNAEITLLSGGQPVYYYMISAE